jgi:pyruvate/2-oxoglutarate dehydrogenase complex dihydrolipoamide acyltransferase (E2) component
MVRKMAKDQGIDIGQVLGTGPQGRVLENDLKAYKSGGSAAVAAPSRGVYDNSRANATSAGKKLATDLGVYQSRITGPGAHLETDVRARRLWRLQRRRRQRRQEPVLASTTASRYPGVDIAAKRRHDGSVFRYTPKDRRKNAAIETDRRACHAGG